MVESHTDESVQKRILEALNKNTTIDDTLEFAKSLSIDHKELDKSLKSLMSDDYIVL